MKRVYQSGIETDVSFFVGHEVEKTPAHGLKTSFVVGIQPVEEIKKHLDSTIRHIFFGANHSYNPDPSSFDEMSKWEIMIMHSLEIGYLCTLDIPMSVVEEFNDGGLNEFNNFIPQIRIPIPYIKLWNYNTMIKLDDRGFNDTNPGVWCHSLHTLQDRSKFTDWNEYSNDSICRKIQ